MESRSFTYQRGMIHLPTIKENYLPDRNVETWQASKVKIVDRAVSKSPAQRNYFMQADPIPLAQGPSKSPVQKPKFEVFRHREKKLHDLDLELDHQELKHLNKDSLKSLELLFFSYSAYLEGITECISSSSHVFKAFLTRAKSGFISVFRSMLPRLKQYDLEHDEKSCQTLMSINVNKYSSILDKLGDIVNEELAGTEKLERFIQKNFISSKRKMKVSTMGCQTEYRTGDNGVILYGFKTYEELEKELEEFKKVNKVLMQEKSLMENNYEELSDTKKLVYRNSVLESMVLRMRHSGVYKTENDLNNGDKEDEEDFSDIED